MSVADFMDRFMEGGLQHKYFQKIANICSDWYIGQLGESGLNYAVA